MQEYVASKCNDMEEKMLTFLFFKVSICFSENALIVWNVCTVLVCVTQQKKKKNPSYFLSVWCVSC